MSVKPGMKGRRQVEARDIPDAQSYRRYAPPMLTTGQSLPVVRSSIERRPLSSCEHVVRSCLPGSAWARCRTSLTHRACVRSRSLLCS